MGGEKTGLTKAGGIEIRLFAQNPGTPKSLRFENCVLQRRHP